MRNDSDYILPTRIAAQDTNARPSLMGSSEPDHELASQKDNRGKSISDLKNTVIQQERAESRGQSITDLNNTVITHEVVSIQEHQTKEQLKEELPNVEVRPSYNQSRGRIQTQVIKKSEKTIKVQPTVYVQNAEVDSDQGSGSDELELERKNDSEFEASVKDNVS